MSRSSMKGTTIPTQGQGLLEPTTLFFSSLSFAKSTDKGINTSPASSTTTNHYGEKSTRCPSPHYPRHDQDGNLRPSNI